MCIKTSTDEETMNLKENKEGHIRGGRNYQGKLGENDVIML